MWPIAGLLTACFLFQAQAEQGKSDTDLLQGSWEAVRITIGGKEPEKKKDITIVFTFKGDKLFTSGEGKDTKEEEYKLDATKSPKQIDIGPRGQGKGLTGIYDVKDDTLLIGYSFSDKRPNDFTDAAIVMTLKKKKS